MGSPEELEKNPVEKFRSNKSIVIAAAKTGSEIKSKKATVHCAVIKRGQTPRLGAKANIVIKKLIEDIMEDTPAKCKVKIMRSPEKEELNGEELKGGYKVQPENTPLATTELRILTQKAINRIQKERLFRRGQIMSMLLRYSGSK